MAWPDAFDKVRRVAPNQLLAIAVAVIVGAAAGWVGIQARKATTALAGKRTALQRTIDDMANVQQLLRVPTPTETASLLAEASRLSSLGVPEADRLVLVDSIGRLAEACGLSHVRASARERNDSLFALPRAIVSQTLPLAGYELEVEFAGGFAEVIKFVNTLPPSVSVSRFRAGRRGQQTEYQMVLLVYQLNVSESG